jgi:protease-4
MVEPAQPLSLEELGERFERIACHRNITGIVIHLRDLEVPKAQVETLQGMLALLRERGKEVVVWATSYKRTAYQVAMAADKVLMQEGGSIGVLGFSTAHTYLGDSLAWAGLQMEAVQISPYKSAADRLVRADMSPEVRQMNDWLLDSYWASLKRDIAHGRNVSVEQAEEIIHGSPYTTSRAASLGLVDSVVSEEDLAHILGRDGKPAVLSSWSKAERALKLLSPARRDTCIGVIRVTGSIVDGTSGKPPLKPPLPIPFLFSERAGDMSVVAQARRALKDKRVKKPVVALMGAVAASGGYYVTTAAQWVVAQPGTLTGSIGVLTGKLVDEALLKKLLANRITLHRGESALLASSAKPYSEREREVEWENISAIYELFLRRVAEARKMTAANVDAVGGGRVWTGEQAFAHGLVDELGGLSAAVAKLCAMAKVPVSTSLWDMGAARGEPPLTSAAAAFSYAFDSLRLFSSGRALCLCPYVFEEE